MEIVKTMKEIKNYIEKDSSEKMGLFHICDKLFKKKVRMHYLPVKIKNLSKSLEKFIILFFSTF